MSTEELLELAVRNNLYKKKAVTFLTREHLLRLLQTCGAIFDDNDEVEDDESDDEESENGESNDEADDSDVAVERLTSYSLATAVNRTETLSGDPRQLFTDGLTAFRSGNYANAQAKFESAARIDLTNAKYAYFWALAAKQQQNDAAANHAVAEAVRREVRNPIKSWGRTMERVQGHVRLWIEEARKDAKNDLGV